MKPLFYTLGAVAALGIYATSAQASGDYGCTPAWTAMQSDLTGCNYSAILGPGNDTRVNLLLMMRDMVPAAPAKITVNEVPLFDWRTVRTGFFPDAEQAGYGGNSRCGTNEAGIAAFEAAVSAARDVSTSERSLLIAARKGLEPDCGAVSAGSAAAMAASAGVNSAAAKEFAAYLGGVASFYDGDYTAAANQFASLSKAKQSWVRETASYMVGRVELNHAQESAFDEYGYFAGGATVEKMVIAKALAGFNGYLVSYPNGLYAASARGLMRRLYWLSGDHTKLADAYRALMTQPAGAPNQADLAEEIDSKMLPQMGGDPLLVAVMDLMRMREQGGYERIRLTRSELDAQKSMFAGNVELYDFLQASFAFHVEQKPAEVLRLIPDAARQSRMSYLQFSRQALRGLALDATKDRNARGFWQQLVGSAASAYQRPVAELALAMNLERGNALDAVFAADSAIKDSIVREILLQNIAGPATLRRQAVDKSRPAHERDVALFTLLYKGVSRGNYADFVQDLNLTPAKAVTEGYFYDFRETDSIIPVGLFKAGGKKGEYPCPSLRDSAATLAKAPATVAAKICIADFMRINGFDMTALDVQPDAKELGGSKSLFAGAPYSRLEVYKSVIADPAAVAGDKSYALFRAVHCYSPGGTNSCGGKDVPVSQRKAWHDRLKRDYPLSQWAKKLRYYW